MGGATAWPLKTRLRSPIAPGGFIDEYGCAANDEANSAGDGMYCAPPCCLRLLLWPRLWRRVLLRPPFIAPQEAALGKDGLGTFAPG